MSDSRRPPLTPEELAERVSLAALEFLTPAEAADLPRQLIAADREAAALLGGLLEPVPPPPSLRDRLLRRVSEYEQLKPASEIRTYDGGWRHTGFPGIDFKPLYHDAKSGLYTNLVRMQPGAQYPRHIHYDDEQCLVISGDVRWGDSRYLQGDFVATRAGVVHPTLETDGGNVLLIISGHNEFLPEHG